MSTVFKNVTTKGTLSVTGVITAKDNLIIQSDNELWLNADNDLNYVGLKAPTTATSNVVFELPSELPPLSL